MTGAAWLIFLAVCVLAVVGGLWLRTAARQKRYESWRRDGLLPDEPTGPELTRDGPLADMQRRGRDLRRRW